MKHVYHQGCLDDLCGPYAVINAIHRVLPDTMDQDVVDAWYEKIFKKHGVKSKLYGGTTWNYLEGLAAYAAAYVNRKLVREGVPVRVKVEAAKWARNSKMGELIGSLSSAPRRCHVVLLCDKDEEWHYVALAKSLEARASDAMEWLDSSEYFSDGPYPDLSKSRSSFSLGGYRKKPRARYVIDRRYIAVTAEEVVP